jgi:hypothetical protein
MFIYSIDNILFVHSDSIIKKGEIKIIDINGNIVKKLKMENKDYAAFSLDIPAGKYKVDLSASDENTVKHIFINTTNKTAIETNN